MTFSVEFKVLFCQMPDGIEPFNELFATDLQGEKNQIYLHQEPKLRLVTFEILLKTRHL